MKKLGELLREAGLLDDAGLQRALARQKQTGQRLGEALIELRLITEDQLFDTLAKQLSIPIIAEPKLLMVEVQKAVIAMLEPAIAWTHYALPLLVDPAKTQLAIVTAEPSDPSTVAAVRRATGVNTVKTYLAKRSAMRKVLEKYYGPPPASGSGDEGIGELLLEEAEPEPEPEPAPPPPRPADRVSRPTGNAVQPTTKSAPASIGRIELGTKAAPPAVNSFAQEEPSQSIRAKVAAKQRVIKRVIVADSNKSVAGGVKRSLEMEGFTVEIATSEAEILNLVKTKGFDLVVAKGAIAENIGELERRVRSVFPLIEFRVVPSFATALMGDPVPYTRLTDFTFDAFDLFLSLLERGDAKARARAQTNSRYAKMIAQRLQLPRKSIDEVYYAAYLDAVGDVLVRQRGGDPGDRGMARKLSLELFRNVNPPYDAETILLAAEERVDGSGPRGMKGDQIPLGARILSVVFGYHDAKGIPRDQLQKFMRDMSGRTFDNRIVETFLQILRQEALLGESGGAATATAGTILIVDKDVAHTSTLELRLSNEGYRVAVCGDGQAALELARQDPPILILSEIALPRMDGFNLCMEIKSDSRTQTVPFVFVSGKNDEFNSNKAMDLGADDFIGKPVNVEFLLKKLKSFLVKPKPAASSGSSSGGRLSDFGIVELIQTLSLGMKTVKLELRHDTKGRGVLYLEGGRIVHAGTEDKAGEEAFYQIATWADGGFEIHSNQSTQDKNVQVSNDFLILEALRRMDEAEAGISQEGKDPSSTGKK